YFIRHQGPTHGGKCQPDRDHYDCDGRGFCVGGLLVAVVTYGDAIFSRGMSVRDVVHSAVEELATKQSKAQ
ncbi:MAG TPA: hypothetical protein VH414_05335, partial [Lichenihabitans sp.]|nr:hypothetical protein [Lichenihabitans sp.]